MGFWLLARAAAPQLLAVEVAGAVAMTSLPVLLMPRLGLVGSAVGFFLGSLLHGGLLLWLVRRRAGRHLRPAPLLAALGSAAILLVVQFGAAYDAVLGATLGGLLLLAAGLAAARLYLRGHR
jgi:peptidoglycan biosynthesis protein MviN/MurJ (putative lipid II flippase)